MVQKLYWNFLSSHLPALAAAMLAKRPMSQVSLPAHLRSGEAGMNLSFSTFPKAAHPDSEAYRHLLDRCLGHACSPQPVG
jgi:hypothetical protein